VSIVSKSKIVGLVTVRTSSSRLPNKCLLPFGDETVISHVVKRAIKSGIEPIICTSTDSSDDILEEIAKTLGVKCFRGDLINKLKRWADCANNFNLEAFHTIDADDPFFDGDEVIRSMEILSEGGCDLVCPSESSSAGGASVGYSIKKTIIEKALSGLDDNTDTEMMWYFLEKVTDINSRVLDDKYSNSPQVRLTLDYVEDYWMLASIVNILGNNATRSDLSKFLTRNPDFSKINFFRNQEWKKAQIEKKI
jgi:spore coat polysaccharide biosynthesis protein SpsF